MAVKTKSVKPGKHKKPAVKRKCKARKKTEFKNVMTRAVFLHGRTDKDGTALLKQIQQDFNDDTQRFINELSDDKYVPQLILSCSESEEMRALEKQLRSDERKATFSQAAFDNAFNKMANRADNIRSDILSVTQSILVVSKQLYAMLLSGATKQDMISSLCKRQDAKAEANKERDKHVDEWIEQLRSMTEAQFNNDALEILDCYRYGSYMYKVPEVSKEHVRLVSTNYTFTISNENPSKAVIKISKPGKDCFGRIEIPLVMTEDAVRRFKQYGHCNSAEYTVMENGMVRVSVAFRKKCEEQKGSSYRGVDIGITDAFHADDTGAIGTMKDIIDFYKNVVEPAFSERTKLINKKRLLKRYLKKHKKLPDDVIKSIRKKIDRLETMIRKSKKAYRLSRHYKDMLKKRIKDVVGTYIAGLKNDKSKITVLEQLDIKEFNASKKANGSRSMFARGLLQTGLMDKLNWHGYSFIQVDPAYTSAACPHCSYVDAKNRNNKSFKCLCCGHEDDADHVGSVNIKSRAFDKEIIEACNTYQYDTKKRHKAIKMIYSARNLEWMKEM